MAVPQLRSYIPISAPARREPVDGTESRLRPVLGFEPAWFRRRCGVDFSERWHRDPHYRRGTLAAMKAALYRAFPAVDRWRPGGRDDLATISGCYGICVIPAAFGLPIRFDPDRWPAPEVGHHLSVEGVETLDVDRALASPLVDDLMRQMDIIEAEWGSIDGYLNWQGILNNAFHLRGQEIFADLVDRPELARHLFAVICETMIQLAAAVQARQRRSGFAVDQLDVSNCTMNMIAPRTYRAFLFEHDRRIAARFARFGVHTCNWNATPYLDVLWDLPNVGYLDMGIMSDMRRAREVFPDARRAVIYSPVRLQDASHEDIKSDMQRIVDELGPCDVVLADVQADTPDERVNEVLRICREVESRGQVVP